MSDTIREDQTPKPCETVLLDDYPADSDAFGPHQTVADAIVAMVRSEKGGRAVALEGTWGSGKSTIVGLLQQQLPKSIFVFDAWSHEGDPLRRVFLEKLIDYFEPHIDKKKWGRRKRILARRLKIEESKTTPHLTFIGVLFGFLAFLLPAGAAFLAASLSAPSISYSSFEFKVGISITTAPFALYLLALLTNLVRYGYRRLQGASTDHISLGSVALFLNKSETQHRTERYETPDPTSLEFEEDFVELLKDVFQRRKQPIIVIVDNLDRVPRDYALSVWATLRIFLEKFNTSCNEDWVRHTWLLVPYDQPALAHLWIGGSPTRNVKRTRESEPPKSNGNRKDDSNASAPRNLIDDSDLSPTVLSNAFLQKTFQVRFDVPPLVLADWKEYVERLLRTALPNHADGIEFNLVYRLFAKYHRGRWPPTPRQLKLYINDIGALHRQWCIRGIPLAHIAYYVILRYSGRDILAELHKNNLPTDDYKAIIREPEVIENLRAMVFNKSVTEATHVFFADSIRRALWEGDNDEMRALLAQRGFWEALDPVLQDLPAPSQEDPLSLANAGMCLLQSGVSVEASEHGLLELVQDFARKSIESRTWTALNEQMAQGLSAYMTILNNERDSSKVLEQVIESVPLQEEGKDVNGDQVVAWAKGLVVILHCLTELGHHSVSKGKLRLPSLPILFVETCRILAQNEDQTRRYWAEIATDDERLPDILQHVTPEPSNAQWQGRARDSLRVMLESRIAFPWNAFTQGLRERLKVVKLSPDQVHESVQALWLVRKKDGGVLSALSQLSEGGHLYHHFNRSMDAGHERSGVACLATILAVRDIQAGPPQELGSSAAGFQKVQALMSDPAGSAALVEQFSAMLDGWLGSQIFPRLFAEPSRTKAFANRVIAYLVQKKQLGRCLSAQIVVQNSEQIREILAGTAETEVSVTGVVRELLEDGGFSDYLAGQKFKPDQARLYTDVINAGGAAQPRVKEWLVKGLTATDKEHWIKDLLDQASTLGMASELQRQSPGLHLEGQYLEALVQMSRDLLAGGAPSQLTSARLQNALSLLSPELLDMLIRRVVGGLALYSPGQGSHFFEIYGPHLASAGGILASAQDLVSAVFCPAVTEMDQPVVKWVVDVIEKNDREEFLNNFRKDDVDYFKNTVVEKVEDPKIPQAEQQDIVRLANILKLRYSELGETTDSDEMSGENENQT